MSFILCASKLWSEPLTIFKDSNTRLLWRATDHFWVYAATLATLFLSVLVFLFFWVKVHSKCHPLAFHKLENDVITCMERLDAKVLETHVLNLPSQQGAYTVDNLACNMEIACVLLQNQPDRSDLPINYGSHRLKDAEGAHNSAMSNGVVWYRHCCFSDPYWGAISLPSCLITTPSCAFSSWQTQVVSWHVGIYDSLSLKAILFTALV